MSQPDLSRLSPNERKAYSEGVAIIRRKLEAGRQAEAQRKAAEANRVAKFITARVGATVANRCFGVPTASPAATVSKPSTRRKNYSEGGETNPRTLKRFCTTRGLFG